MHIIDDGYKQLASAVINLALKDREEALMKINSDPGNKKTWELLRDCDEFFTSEWFEELLDVSGLEINFEEVKEKIYEHQRIS